MNELKSNDQQGDSERNIQQPPPPVEGGHQAINDPTGGNHGDHKKTNWPQRIEAVCAVLLVIITGTYTYYAAGQLHKMKRSTEATERAAEAAKNAVELARRTAHIDQRAYLSIKITSVPAKEGKALRTVGIVSNHGKTYALNVTACKVGQDVMNNPPVNPVKEPPSFYDCSKPKAEWHPHGVIAPNSDVEIDLASMSSPGRVGLNKIAAAAVNMGMLVTWEYGQIRYDDIFGCSHWVQFCYNRAPTSDGSPATFVVCNGEGRNTVDLNECEGK
jgi:hypothetical protein